MFGGIYKDRVVLVTGHTGFKGSWLALWLKELGANVIGFSLPPQTDPNHFDLLTLQSSNPLNIISIEGDIREKKRLEEILQTYNPEIVFHMAAQSLVRYSYKNPIETFETNVMGTINVFEACRNNESIRAIVNVTSDKCYENKEWVWGYRENDPMGGYDPYSASKGCAELVTSAYRNSFFSPSHPLTLSPSHYSVLLASARAGNVIGGGDWAEDRLIPDIMRAISKNAKVIIRNPKATRPWQHVLEPLSGYLMLGQKLLEGKKEFAEGWNFGPDGESNICVEDVVRKMKDNWQKIDYQLQPSNPPTLQPSNPHEAGLLKLDCSKAHARLNWKPVWNIEKTISMTTRWYRGFYENGTILSLSDLHEYVEDAGKKDLIWAK
jgi:CDP-glucose 4,6-dehydratase